MAKGKDQYKEDWALVEAVREGNRELFRKIVEQNERFITKVTVGMLSNTADAEDIAQETFLRFYRMMHQYKGDSSLRTYLTKIAINLSLNMLKKRKAEAWKNRELSDNVLSDEIDLFKKMDDSALIEKALTALPEEFRSVVVLRLVQGFSTKETAGLLHVPQGTVLSRLARGQQKLREIIIKLQNIQIKGGRDE